MRLWRVQWAGFLVLALGSVLAGGRAAGADEFAAFRIPDHWTRTGAAELNGSGSWSTADQFDSYRRRSSYRLSTTVGLGSDRDSDHLAYGGSVSLSGRLDRERERYRSNSGAENSKSWDGSERLAMAGTMRFYPRRGPFGVGLTARVSQELRRMDSHRARQSSSTGSELQRQETRVENRSVWVTAQAGYGQIRDATVVFFVDVLEQRLQAAGVLAQALGAETRRKLAELFFISEEFHAVHDRAARFFWREVERVLQEDGALGPEGLDAYAIYRISDPVGTLRPSPTLRRGKVGEFNVLFDQSEFQRLRGFFAGGVLEVEHQHLLQIRDETVTGTTTRSRHVEGIQASDRVRAGVRAAAHRPLGWHWQVGGDTRLTVPVRPDEHGFRFATSTAVTWLIAERWRAVWNFDHGRDVFEPRDSEALVVNQWNVGSRASLEFYLEDRVSMSLQLRTEQERNVGTGYSRGWSRDSELSLGMRYRFLGALDGPSWLTPQRLLSPGFF